MVDEALGRIAGEAGLAALFALVDGREVRDLVATLLDLQVLNHLITKE